MIQQHAWSLIFPNNFSNECLHRHKFLMRTWKCLCKIAVFLLGHWAAHVEQFPCVHVHALMISSPLHTITQSTICFSLSWSALVFCDISSAFWSAVVWAELGVTQFCLSWDNLSCVLYDKAKIKIFCLGLFIRWWQEMRRKTGSPQQDSGQGHPRPLGYFMSCMSYSPI